MTIRIPGNAVLILIAFLNGVLIVAGISLTLRESDNAPQTSLAPSTTTTPARTATSAPSATALAAAQPTAAAPTPLPGTATAPTVAAPARPTSVPAPPSTPAPPEPGSGYAFIGAVWADDFMPIPYCVNPDNPPISSNGQPLMSGAALAQAVQRGFQTWQDIQGSYITFAYQGICSNDPFDTRDQTNTVGWGWLFSSAVGAAVPSATHGTFMRQNSLGQIYELDIVVDIRYAQSFDDEAEYINRALPWVLLHEIGHFIGLDHSENPCSIMQPVIVDADPVLCDFDRAGARALYPEQ